MMDFRIIPIEGYDEKIGELVSMLDYSRAVLLDDIKSLTQEDLDFLPEGYSNTIGGLLMHIASIDFVHQVISFENRDLNDQELLEWGAALELGEQARDKYKNQPLSYYIEKLCTTRAQALARLKTMKDSWLSVEKKWDNGVAHNHYWLWYHVMEDEINHRGQIRILKRLLENRV
ncbi:DinB family protein [Bacillus sp. 31A1R]|uniref:DinB family protein n=1 Tax=Robertmurraya mangrovi TaxID=3098077 RepID=A0ABU5IWD0_9BACI|nr:DinB family protein [Bacillus sp. 31A1R]MDZ5471441.1 DinB family protein [Bacillus sp. 31A1R]